MKRSSGILLHIATLPGKYGIGSFGKEAFAFADFLSDAHQHYWQILPLVPTGYGDSPYQSACSYAGNEYFIDLEILFEKGLLTAGELSSAETGENSRIDYFSLFKGRIALLKKAFSRFDASGSEFSAFLEKGEFRDYALFRALKEKFAHAEMSEWPDEYKFRDKRALNRFELEYKNDIIFWQWAQFEFFNEWKALKSYANGLGIRIIGDIPIYVSRDSVECWTQPELFKLDESLKPTFVAGCPPDYFSATGQLWGNPIYEWARMKEDGYAGWKDRIRKVSKLYDVVRIDHFRGFDRFYEIPASEPSAAFGRWTDGPGAELFVRLKEAADFEIIAEDLGTLDARCVKMLKDVGFPGMKVLSFAFDSDETNVYLPSNYDTDNSVVYTGTHDNDVLMSFIRSLGDGRERFAEKVRAELSRNGLSLPADTDADLAECLIELAMRSRAVLSVIPIQDWALEPGGRINCPSTLSAMNWSYRIDKSVLSKELSERISRVTDLTLRNN